MKAFKEELEENLEMAALIIGTGQDTDFPIDPFTFDMGDLTEADLSPRLLTMLRATTYECLNINPTDKPEPVASYSLQDENPDDILVKVFEGKSKNPETGEEDTIFLHEVVGPRGLSWVASASQEPSPFLVSED